MRLEDFITMTPGVRNGKPCIRGTRITVGDVLESMASGMSEAEILSDFPDLRAEHLRAVLAFAAARERRLAEPLARTPMSPELDDLTRQLTEAMHEGVERARLIHKALGVPMVVWRDGRVQWLDADTLEAVAPPADGRKIPET